MRELENFREYTNTSNLNAIKEGAILLTPDERNQIEEIIPKKFKTHIVLKRDEFLNQVKAASLFSGKINEIKIKMLMK